MIAFGFPELYMDYVKKVGNMKTPNLPKPNISQTLKSAGQKYKKLETEKEKGRDRRIRFNFN